MVSNNPKLTIILATLNAGATIERCLQSVADQSYQNYELIIQDGVSCDDTLKKVERFTSLIDMNVESSRDGGIYGAWNKALARARGEWVMFIGADDYFPSDCTLADLLAFASGEEADLITVRNAEVDDGCKVIRVYGEPWVWDRFRRFMSICHVGLLHRKSLFDCHGRFDEQFRIAGDYEFLMRIGKQITAVDYDKVVACCGNEGVSHRRLVRAFSEAIWLQYRYKSTCVVISAIRYGLFYLRFRVRNMFV